MIWKGISQTGDDIAGDTGGSSSLTMDPDQDIRRFHVENLVWALQNNSPQLIDYRYDSVSHPIGGPPAATETFAVNSSAKKVLLKLSWQPGRNLDFEVWKDANDLTNAGDFITGPFYKIYLVDIPISVGGKTVDPGGDWSMEITGDAGTSYEVAAIVDEPSLNYSLSLDQLSYAAGDEMRIDVDVSVAGSPMSGARHRRDYRPDSEPGDFPVLDAVSISPARLCIGAQYCAGTGQARTASDVF